MRNKNKVILSDLPAGGELVRVWVQSEGVGCDGHPGDDAVSVQGGARHMANKQGEEDTKYINNCKSIFSNVCA